MTNCSSPLRNTGQEARFTSEYVSRILVQLDLVSRILGLCHTCMQRSTANQWARYCYVTCQPPRSTMPLDEDPTGTLRLVYPSQPTARQLREAAGLDKLPA